jgi:hypothetical protein
MTRARASDLRFELQRLSGNERQRHGPPAMCAFIWESDALSSRERRLPFRWRSIEAPPLHRRFDRVVADLGRPACPCRRTVEYVAWPRSYMNPSL